MTTDSTEAESVPPVHEGAEDRLCFHCGLAAGTGDEALSLEVGGGIRHFCCHGCLAVCDAIVEAGFADYYRLRDSKPGAPIKDKIPDFLRRAELYGRPDIERTFTRYGDGWREACLLLEEVHCPACLWLSEGRLRNHPGVIAADVDYNMHQATVRWDPAVCALPDLIRTLAAIGYLAHPYDPEHSRKLAVERRRRSTERLIFAAVIGMLVMHMSLGAYLMGGAGEDGKLPAWEQSVRWISAALSLLILAYPGQEFLIGAWRAIRSGKPTMDVPITLGLLSAFAGSLHSTVGGVGDVYYDSIGMLVLFVLFARRLELNGRELAAARLDRFGAAAPATARVVEDGGVVEKPVAGVRPGQQINVVPGDTIPLDGVVVQGQSAVNESLVTGEAIPVLRSVGDRVIAGSVNGEQPLVVEVTSDAAASSLSVIRGMISKAQRSRPAASMLADRIAGYLVVFILILAAATAAAWWSVGSGDWLAHMIAVLIITCPCALALATPVAFAISAGRLLENGIVPADMSALDAVASASTVVFDKTGTLTEGRLVVDTFVTVSDLGKSELARIARALAEQTRHPVSRALLLEFGNAATVPALQASAVRHFPGLGVSAVIGGREWFLGSYELVVRHCPGIRVDQEPVADAGQVVACLADADRLHGWFVLEDAVRTEAIDVIGRLRTMGVVEGVVLSGDAEANVRNIVRLLGLDRGYSRLDPQAKLDRLRQLRAETGSVIAVGEGLNDAPLLAAADASIAIGEASDLSRLSSHFVVLSGALNGLVRLRDTAIRTRRIVRQNLVWALAYNLLSVPLAAAGMVSPWLAAIGMSASSLIVVGNSLRLNRSGHSPRNEGSSGPRDMETMAVAGMPPAR